MIFCVVKVRLAKNKKEHPKNKTECTLGPVRSAR